MQMQSWNAYVGLQQQMSNAGAGADAGADAHADAGARSKQSKHATKKIRKGTSLGKRDSARQGSGSSKHRPGKKTAAAEVEDISLSMSEDEESEEDEDDASMGSFIDDEEQDEDAGVDHRAMDLAFEDSHDKKKAKRCLPEALEDEEKKKKKRSEQRELVVTYERGRGDTRRSVLEYHDKAPFYLPCSDFVTPWDRQPERKIMDVGHERGKLAEGAFGLEAHARWFNSDEQQARFAEAFSVPYDESFQMKKLSSDVLEAPRDPQQMLSNATSKILHCLRVTHAATELDDMEGKHYDEVFVGLQRTSRALRQEMDGGPNGGLQSCAVDVLWNIYHGEETSNISENILRLLEILTMAKQGSRGDELYHVVATDRVEWFTKGRVGLTKVQCGVRTKRPYNFHEATNKGARCAVQDIDPRLLRKLWNFRNDGEDFETVSKQFIALSSLVHDRHQVNCPEMTGAEIKQEEQVATDPNPLKIYLFKDVLPAWDEAVKQPTTVSIEAIYLVATCPANDPLVFLKSIAENNPAAGTLLSNTFVHMSSVLGQPSCSWDQLFNTDRAGAADLTPESRMLEGLFRFCDARKLVNVSIGGFRMDVRNKKEMKVWKDYIEPLKSARGAHYRMVIKETLHDRTNKHEALLPVAESAKWMDFYHGQTYWRVRHEQVDKEIDDYAAMWEDEEERRDVYERLKDWQRSHIQSVDGLSMFVPEGEGWARNSGLWIRIKTENSRTHEEELREASRKPKAEERVVATWTQPQQECRLMKIWLSNAKDRASSADPLDLMLEAPKWIPDIDWMNKILPNMDEHNDSVEWLKEMIGEYVTARCKRNYNTDVRLLEIMQLVGKERNPVHKGIASIEDVCSVELLFRTKMQKINTSVKTALVQMHSSELLQWRIAAMNINDLKKQRFLRDKWTDDFRSMLTMTKNLQDSDEWMDLLCVSTLPSVFFNLSMARLNADLSYMNQLFMWNFICCTMAHNENRRGAYGMTMRVMDMAGTVDVLKEVDVKERRSTIVVKVTEKSPGAGADTSISFVMQMLVSSLTHISQTKEVKELAYTTKDTIHKNVSKMSYALLQGSGVMVNARGEIMGNNTTFQKELSNNAHFTELFKNDEDPAMLAWLESLMAHSGDVQVGAESGVNQAAWTTTMSLENWNVQRLKPMPVIVLTGNRPAQGTPASAVEGGRWMCIASSTQDKDNGFFKVPHAAASHKTYAMSVLPRVALLPVSTNHADNTDKRTRVQQEKSTRAHLANKQSTGDIRKDIKIISREDVLGNMMHFLLMQWLRKDAALLLSALTHEAKSYWYSMKCTYTRMECAVGHLTSGLKRDFLDKNAQFWHRNAMGPWNKVTQVSMHVFLTMSAALLDTMARAHDKWPVDLHLGFMLGIRALMTNTISFMAMLASLQLWLCSAVLDYNLMILSCYIYHFTAFQHPCSLHILSLVLLGHKLSEEEHEKYVLFCDHIAPCVLEGHMKRARADKGPRNVTNGTLPLPGHTTLGDWFSSQVPTMQPALKTAHLSRFEGDEQQRLSVYCQPRMGFVQVDGIRGFGKTQHNFAAAPDPNISGTPRRVLGTVLGNGQRQAEHQKRVEKGACIDGHSTETVNGQPQKKKLEAWENTVEFWKTVRKGTLLPESSTSTNDIFKVKFEFTPHTGIWWDTTMQNAGTCDGVLKHFLLQSDLDLGISHHEFFTRLLQPYLDYKGSTDRVYGGPDAAGPHRNAWKEPVLGNLNVFEFSSYPYMDAQQQVQGVYVNACMRLVHYVLLQGLGMTSDWDRTAHDDSSFVSCTHLRNVSHMTLGILSLLLHTCCEKAMIPCNSGRLRIPLPSPEFEANTEACVLYDNRLHVDTHLHLMGGASDNMLSTDSRLALPSNWRLVNFPNGDSALLYSSVLDACPHLVQAASSSHLFPFPPESVAHASCSFQDMYIALRRFMDNVAKDPEFGGAVAENLFALAMLKLGSSIRFEDFQHTRPSLTDCAVRDAREIPCVTLEHGFLFTISFSEGRLLLRPVAPTHAWERVCDMASDDARPFQRLPLAREATLSSGDFLKLFRHGLAQTSASPCEVAVDITFSKAKRLPFYMFPVMHFPVLVLVQRQGWSMPVPDAYEDYCGDSLILDTSENMYIEHMQMYYLRPVGCDIEKAWFQKHCPALLTHSKRKELTELEAYFFSEDTGEVLGLWARYEGLRVHFNDIHHLETGIAKGIDVSLFLASTDADDFSEYYMLRHDSWGLAPVCLAGGADSERLVARFPYFYDKSQDAQHLETLRSRLAQATHDSDARRVKDLEEEIAEWRAEMDAQPDVREAFREIQFTREFNDFVPNIMPVGEGREETDACWGLVVERDGAFLADGCYTVSVLSETPAHTYKSHSIPMDFIAMSRCMLPEGSELWIKINKAMYKLVLEQAQQQGCKVMLPVSATLHHNMPEPLVCYLRCYYVLGGSVHDSPVDSNSATMICAIASRRSVPGKRATVDDKATAASRVNQNIAAENTRFVAISLPIFLEDYSTSFDYSRDPALPFYKYLKER